jgi:hypothetical protein
MTPAIFRKLALSLEDAVESSHMNHPDFRFRNKIFATLGPAEAWAGLSLTPDQQAIFVQSHPKVFEPFSGAWGRRGATKVHLKPATKAVVTPALVAAYENIASKSRS